METINTYLEERMLSDTIERIKRLKSKKLEMLGDLKISLEKINKNIKASDLAIRETLLKRRKQVIELGQRQIRDIDLLIKRLSIENSELLIKLGKAAT